MTVAVSIIVAAYKAEATLDRALDSVRAQSRADWECIVVDDASPDATAAVAARHAAEDARVRLVRMPHNGGPGAARNAGLNVARGEWIAMLDADDAFTPSRLSDLLAVAGDLDMVADDLVLDTPGEPPRPMLGEAIPPQGLDVDARRFIAGNRGAHGQGRVLYGFLKPLVRRAFLAKHGLRYRELRLAEDYFLYLEALLAGAQWRVVPQQGYVYAVRPDSLTATFTPDALDAMAQADRLILQQGAAPAHSAEAAAIRRHRAEVLAAAAWTRLVRAVRGRDARELRRAMQAPPSSWPGVVAKAADAARRAMLRGVRR